MGQFFTPRCIVEFMVRMVDPKEGDVICDPASGSGGFLIRFFETVREQILADADRQYRGRCRSRDHDCGSRAWDTQGNCRECGHCRRIDLKLTVAP
ncbi:MAG TPA: N-6 DNA methylase [Candidatus Paceibacterota bacterium]|nr:N-6 DNA methylase [Candidatus Paceibacterota bacterium]HRZ57362.1 N-6 DNA methylase [Candidatus Paceibacterota bacterium]